MSNLFEATKRGAMDATLAAIISRPLDLQGWSLQGFGMLRLYLTPEIRLHVWDSTYAVPDVSLLHDHPWDFESYIFRGTLHNQTFVNGEGEPSHEFCTIKCGPGGGVRSAPESCTLSLARNEVLTSGEIYRQRADEIHLSNPVPGTVTIIERTFRPDTEHARVFWPIGKNWVSAEPRPATEEEILAITGKVLI